MHAHQTLMGHGWGMGMYTCTCCRVHGMAMHTPPLAAAARSLPLSMRGPACMHGRELLHPIPYHRGWYPSEVHAPCLLLPGPRSGVEHSSSTRPSSQPLVYPSFSILKPWGLKHGVRMYAAGCPALRLKCNSGNVRACTMMQGNAQSSTCLPACLEAAEHQPCPHRYW